MGCAHDYKGFRKWIRLNLSFFFHNHLITLDNTFMNPWIVFKKKWRLRGEKIKLLHEVSSRVTLNSTHPSLQHVHSTQAPFLFSPQNSSLPHITLTQSWHFNTNPSLPHITSTQSWHFNTNPTLPNINSKRHFHTEKPEKKSKITCRSNVSKCVSRLLVEVTCRSDVSKWRAEVTGRGDV